MTKYLSVFFVIAVTLFGSGHSAEAAVVTTPPGLHPGDQYRLAFVTTTSTTATSSDVRYYDSIVSSAANSNPSLAALNVPWTAIVSTSDFTNNVIVSAIDHTGLDSSITGISIYNLAGQQVAANYADIWGNSFIYRGRVWTGTNSVGMAAGGDLLGLGNNIAAFPSSLSATYGDSAYGPASSGRWILANNQVSSGVDKLNVSHPIYGISGVITVVPEVSPLLLLGFAGVGAIFTRARLHR
jgi:hypothetical protein